MEKLFIDVLYKQTAEDRIDQICKRLGMGWTLEYRSRGVTAVYSLGPKFPVHEIEREWWFAGGVMFMEKLFIDVLYRQAAEDRIDQICKRLGMGWDLEYRAKGATAIYSLDPEFPISEIENEWWFDGYVLKEV